MWKLEYRTFVHNILPHYRISQASNYLFGTQDSISVPLLEQLGTRQLKTPIALEDINNVTPPEYQEEFLEVLNTHLKVFLPGTTLPQTKTIVHQINLTSETLFQLPLCGYSETKKRI